MLHKWIGARFRFSLRTFFCLVILLMCPFAYVGRERSLTRDEGVALSRMGFTSAEIEGLREQSRMHVPAVMQFLPILLGPKLDTLYIEGNRASELANVTKFRSLERLTVCNVQSPITGIEALSSVSTCGRLCIYNCGLADPSALSQLRQVWDLDIVQSNVRDLSPLSNMTQLVALDVSGNRVNDLSPIKGLTKLAMLKIADTEVHDLSPLADMNELGILILSRTPVRDLTPISRSKLSKLVITGCPVDREEVAELQRKLPDCRIEGCP